MKKRKFFIIIHALRDLAWAWALAQKRSRKAQPV
jgi:hypothetical protein